MVHRVQRFAVSELADLARRLGARARSAREDERGAVILIVALILTALMIFAALVIDLGNARQFRRSAQAAADAAALAGIQESVNTPATWDDVVTMVKTYALNNDMHVPLTAWAGCTDPDAMGYKPDPPNSCISADSALLPPAHLRVRLPIQAVPAFFGRVAGYNAYDVRAVATAGSNVNGGPCGLCVLNPHGAGVLKLFGSAGGINVVNTSIVVDSDSPDGSQIIGSDGSIIAGTTIGGPGGFTVDTDSDGTFQPTPIVQDAVADPLGGLPMCPSAAEPSLCPTNSQGAFKLGSGSPGTINPGIYSSITLSGSSKNLKLNPGVYVITGPPAAGQPAALTLSGSSGQITADGVTFYFACRNYPTPCASGESGAGFSVNGSSGVLKVSAPTTGTFQGLSFYADRNNTASNSIVGSSGGAAGGTIYTKSGSLSLGGSSANITLTSLVVVDSVNISGSSGTLTLNSDPVTTNNVRFHSFTLCNSASNCAGQ